MKRICSWCTKDLGEACMICGATQLLGPLKGVYACLHCQRMWAESSEPITHTICGPCLKVAASGVQLSTLNS